MRLWLILLFLVPNPFYAQIIVKVNPPLRYRIGSPNNWNTLSDKTNISSSGSIHIAVGTINAESTPQYEVELYNDSTIPLTILNAYWGEPYIQPEWIGEPIAPGSSGKIRYTIHTRLIPGKTIARSCFVHTNFGPLVIHFNGNVLPKYLQLDSNTSILAPSDWMHTSFRISNKVCDDCPDSFKIDSVRTDAYTEVTFEDTVAYADSVVIFHVNVRSSGKTPQSSAVQVYIHGVTLTHFIYIDDGKRKKRI